MLQKISLEPGVFIAARHNHHGEAEPSGWRAESGSESKETVWKSLITVVEQRQPREVSSQRCRSVQEIPHTYLQERSLAQGGVEIWEGGDIRNM